MECSSMRKADYSALATIIRMVREHNKNSRTGKDIKPDAVMAAENIAREFSRVASVKPAEFLKACGITP